MARLKMTFAQVRAMLEMPENAKTEIVVMTESGKMLSLFAGENRSIIGIRSVDYKPYPNDAGGGVRWAVDDNAIPGLLTYIGVA